MPLWFVIAVLGIIEGITEFLPVSSTGHLLIAEHWLGLHQSDLFNIVIQCGAVIAVLPLFPDRLHQFIFKWRERRTLDYLVKLSTAFVITGIGGFLMDKKDFKLKDNPVPIAVAMFIGGVAFIVVETVLRSRSPKNEVTWPIVVAVGLGQLLAAGFPGTSRSGATILLALALGLNRVAATEFDDAGSGRAQDIQSHSPYFWRAAGELGHGGVGFRRRRGGLVYHGEVALALYPDPHVYRLWLVPDRARGADCSSSVVCTR
jgi:undecaprenyl pyrophosphate phosphatase UppP